MLNSRQIELINEIEQIRKNLKYFNECVMQYTEKASDMRAKIQKRALEYNEIEE